MLHVGVGSALDLAAYFLSSLPKVSIPSLSSSLYSPLCPTFAIYCLWLSASVAFLVTRTQKSGLSTKGPGQRPSWVWGCCFSPHATAARRGVVCLSMKAAADWGMTQHQDPHGSSLSSLPKASVPSLSSSLCSPLCSTFASDLLSLAIFFGCLSGH